MPLTTIAAISGGITKLARRCRLVSVLRGAVAALPLAAGQPAGAQTNVVDFGCVAEQALSCGVYATVPEGPFYGGIDVSNQPVTMAQTQVPLTLKLGEILARGPGPGQQWARGEASGMCLARILAAPPPACLRPMYTAGQVEATIAEKIRQERVSSRAWTRQRMLEFCLSMGVPAATCSQRVPAADVP